MSNSESSECRAAEAARNSAASMAVAKHELPLAPAEHFRLSNSRKTRTPEAELEKTWEGSEPSYMMTAGSTDGSHGKTMAFPSGLCLIRKEARS